MLSLKMDSVHFFQFLKKCLANIANRVIHDSQIFGIMCRVHTTLFRKEAQSHRALIVFAELISIATRCPLSGSQAPRGYPNWIYVLS